MRLEILPGCENLIEDEMSALFAILLEEVDEVFRIGPDQCNQRQGCPAEFLRLAGPGSNFGDDGISAAGDRSSCRSA